MKVNFEKIFFYCLLIFVSGSIGYAIKPNEPVDQKLLEEKYNNQQRVCSQAIYMMSSFSKNNYHEKSKKEIAIERMLRDWQVVVFDV